MKVRSLSLRDNIKDVFPKACVAVTVKITFVCNSSMMCSCKAVRGRTSCPEATTRRTRWFLQGAERPSSFVPGFSWRRRRKEWHKGFFSNGFFFLFFDLNSTWIRPERQILTIDYTRFHNLPVTSHLRSNKATRFFDLFFYLSSMSSLSSSIFSFLNLWSLLRLLLLLLSCLFFFYFSRDVWTLHSTTLFFFIYISLAISKIFLVPIFHQSQTTSFFSPTLPSLPFPSLLFSLSLSLFSLSFC